MKIGIEAQRIFRSKKHGMDIVAINLIKALQKIDTRNEYFIFTNEQEDTSCLEETSNFKIIRSPGYSYPVWEQIMLPLMVKRNKVDILHCTSNTAPLFTNIPVMLTLHDIIYMENNPLKAAGTMYQKWGNFYRSHVVPFLIKNVKNIITVSNFEKKNIAEYFQLKEDKIKAIYNGVGEHFFKRSSQEKLINVRITYNLPLKYIFLLGNTDPKKNISRTLKAYDLYRSKSSNPLPLVIADYSYENLKKEIDDNGLKQDIIKSIHLLGYVNNIDLPIIYQLSSIFLYPSIRESFGIPILEAMASGTPVITSSISAMPEVAGEAAFFTDPYSIDDISNAMTLVAEDKELRKNLIIKGLQRVQQFKWSESATNLLNLYENI